MTLPFQRLQVNTVDGRDPAPVEVGRLSPLFAKVSYILGAAGFLNHHFQAAKMLQNFDKQKSLATSPDGEV